MAADLSINDVLVGITWIIFVLVVTATVVAYVMRPRRGLRNKNRRQSAYGALSTEVGAGEEKDSTEKKKKKKDTPSIVSDNATDTSSILGAETGLGVRASDFSHADDETQTSNPSEHTLCETLKTVLAQGMAITVYSEEGVKKIKMFLVGTQLRWRTVRMITRKTFKLDLEDIQYIEWGKKTANFRTPAAQNVPDELCFSIVSKNLTIDMKAYNKIERDAVAQGFVMLLEEMRALTVSNTI